jgi:hypothetical protein
MRSDTETVRSVGKTQYNTIVFGFVKKNIPGEKVNTSQMLSATLAAAIDLVMSTEPRDKATRIEAIRFLNMLSMTPTSRDELVRAGALAQLIAAAGDKGLWGSEGQLLAIVTLGSIACVTNPVQRARKMCVVNEGGIDVLISVVTDTNMQGTIFQQRALETIWSICCSKQVILRSIENYDR